MIDIIFISYDEPNAEQHWQKLKARFPYAQRVHGVKGIANAHIVASKKANTSFFYVVDGDADVLDTMNFDYKPPAHDSEYVHIWYAKNPATGSVYGYGGVKLFNKKHFKQVKNALDFSTTLTEDLKIVPEVACVTRFNSDEYRSFRGAFRECFKLNRQIQNPNTLTEEMLAAKARLAEWMNVVPTADFAEYISIGAKEGARAALSSDVEDIPAINDYDALVWEAQKHVLGLDPTTDPNSDIGPEFQFMGLVAGALYDQEVVDNLPVNELRDALSDGQLYSKSWLVKKLFPIVHDLQYFDASKQVKVVVLGGWIGLLPLMIFTHGPSYSRYTGCHVTSIDIDERANKIAEKINWKFKFSAVTADMYEVDYSKFDVIINTASEHIPDISAWVAALPKNKTVIVQNNNMFDHPDHVSCVNSCSELRKKLSLKQVIYEGTRKFPQYDRYMVIGKT